MTPRSAPSPEDNSSPEDPHNPDSRHNRHKRGGAASDEGRCTRYGAVHPIWGGAPVTWRCTRTEEVHCLRIGCSAPTYKNKRGTGTPNHSPPHPSMRSWALLAAGWARRPRRHLHSGPPRPTPTPPTPLNAKSRQSRRLPGRTSLSTWPRPAGSTRIHPRRRSGPGRVRGTRRR